MNQPPPMDTVVFDLDGTLVDSTADVTFALNRMLTESGYPEVAQADVGGLLGKGALSLVESAIESTGRTAPDVGTLEQLNARYLEAYAADPVRESTLYPGVTDTLDRLVEAGILLGVCTNKNERLAAEVLQQLGVLGRFTSVVGGDRLAVRKPDPAHLLATLDDLGSTPESSGLVGDSVYDSRCALAAGARSFVVAWAPPEVEGHRLQNFADLLDHIDLRTSNPTKRTDIV